MRIQFDIGLLETSKKGKILLIDDNPEILESLSLLLKSEWGNITCLEQPEKIPDLLSKESFDVILLDMNFQDPHNTGKEGLYWLKTILNLDPQALVILITAYGEISLAVKAIQSGAIDFITKPWDPEKLIITLRNAKELGAGRKKLELQTNRIQQLNHNIDLNYPFVKGPSVLMESIYRTIEKVGPTQANVLIYGENGTGKELIAREIHRKSMRSSEIFLPVDVGSISESIFESEMFGHVKGAFTDAREDRAGRFEAASGGTLFLDEIGNLPLHQQAKLLSVLQSRQVIRMGSNKPVEVDIRLISATNCKIDEMAKQGRFREDLLYRLNTICIHIPPLRDRPEDIPGLAGYYLGKFGTQYGKPGIYLSGEAQSQLLKHHWPGNIRELRHTIEKAVILCEGICIKADDLGLKYQNRGDTDNFSKSLADIERYAILEAMEQYKGNISQAAKILDISRTTLYNKLQKYKLI